MLFFVITTIVGIALAWVLLAMAFNGNINFTIPLLIEAIIICVLTVLSGNRRKYPTLTICVPAIIMCLFFYGSTVLEGGSNSLNWLWLAIAMFMVWLIADFIGNRVRNILTR